MAQLNCYPYKPTQAVLRHTDIAHLSLDHQLLSDYTKGHTVNGHANIQLGLGLMTHASKCTLLCVQLVMAVSLVQPSKLQMALLPFRREDTRRV